MSNKIRIGVAGLGTVGASVVKILQEQKDMYTTRTGKYLEVVAVSARDKNKDRGFDLTNIKWVDNPIDLASNPDIDLVLELVGGEDGVAKDLVVASLNNKKHVVTANKALLAHHGEALFKLASDNNIILAFEAAIAGGIPIVKALREGLSANHFSAIYGILNGTCNYILTEMWKNGLGFDTALKQAQDAGYAESDPAFDVDGIDAGHKLAILTALAFTGKPEFEKLKIEGLRSLSSLDINYAKELGYRIKLLGIAKLTENGVSQTVSPCMIPETASLATVEGALNAVFVDGDQVGETLYVGAGAGGTETASAVIADIIDIARGSKWQHPIHIEETKYSNQETSMGRFYIRLIVRDEIGVMASVTAILRDCGVSLKSILQYGQSKGDTVSLVLLTHETKEQGILDSVSAFKEIDEILEDPCILRVELT